MRDDAQKVSDSRRHSSDDLNTTLKQVIMKLLILMVNMLEWFSGENDVQFGKFSRHFLSSPPQLVNQPLVLTILQDLSTYVQFCQDSLG